jgi:hypothetical protein
LSGKLLLHSRIAIGQGNKFAGIINFFLKRFPISDGFFESIEFFDGRLGFLTVAPEVRVLGFLFEFFRSISQPVDLKDTPEVFPDAI